jgi:molecular chaperone DnaK (HSP70)
MRGLVGIDLGTSHTVVATLVDGAARVFDLRQRVTPALTESRALLPSVLLAPEEGELTPDPTLDASDWIVGVLARARAAEIPSRVVSSAKSWLCHPRADRRAPILPWGYDDGPVHVSPVTASVRILQHVRRALESTGLDLAACDVILTVPASFDEVARELTLEAAREAGFAVRLLEEPQAALTHALARGALEPLRERLAHVARPLSLLVCDVGGGTTDLSLFRVDADLGVTRTAVGAHLLLGGDNMDLALAHHAEPLLTGEGTLDPTQFAALVASCRVAKERLLSGEAASARVSVAGRGSALVGSTRSYTLTGDGVVALVVDGFFPHAERAAARPRARGGLVSLGLPFERDPAITRHVAAFLDKHAPGSPLDAILLNGGVFRGRALVDRLLEVVASWQDGALPPVLVDGDDPDTAVALGAVQHGRALRGALRRIEGGAPKTYLVGVGGAPPRALTLVPRGTPEGQVVSTSGPPLMLVLGRPARFDLFTSDELDGLQPGDLLEIDERFTRLAPLSTTVPSDDGAKEVGVHLEAELTPIGTLEIRAVRDADASKRHRLAFDLRALEDPSEPRSIAPRSRHLGRDLDQALALVTSVYGKGTMSEAKDAKNLLRELTRLLGEKESWDLDVSRALADRVVSHKKGRRRTADHERVFFQLAGFTSRPGYGAPGDEARVRELAPLFAEGLAFPKEARTWQQLFICYRRLAGGLDEPFSRSLRDLLAPFVAPPELKLKKAKNLKPESSDYEILELLSHLERVPARERADLGSWILERTWTKRDPRFWAAIGRIGARVPAYAELHHVVTPSVAEKWLDHLLREKWADLPTAPRAAAELARLTGDRSRDLAAPLRAELERRLVREGADPVLAQWVRQVVPVAAAEKGVFQGERLPPGLHL